MAILEDDRLAELLVDRPDHRRTVGDIYLGRVEAVLPGIQAAFVDIGQEKSAFLHASDLLEPDEDEEPGDEDEAEAEPAEAAAPAGESESGAEERRSWRRERRRRGRAGSEKGNGDQKGEEKPNGDGDRRPRRPVPNIAEILKKGP